MGLGEGLPCVLISLHGATWHGAFPKHQEALVLLLFSSVSQGFSLPTLFSERSRVALFLLLILEPTS